MAIFLATLFVLVCILLIVVILLQKGRGGGLGAAFGGLGSSAFGTRTGDVFTWVTIVLTALFLILAILTFLVAQPEPGTVTAPIFSPPPGPIDSSVYVVIDCRTPGARVYYTTDDSEPTEESSQYESAVEVIPGMTLKVRAFRARWIPSPVVSGTYGPPATQPAAEAAPATTQAAPTASGGAE